jgi:hypothetical protein
MVSRRSQGQHSVMVRETVQHFYGVGDGHSIEIHDATTNVTPRGTAIEIHHDSDPHISTVCGEFSTSCEQPVKLWLLWKTSKSRRLVICYSNTVAALRHLGPCGFLIQYPCESLLLSANVHMPLCHYRHVTCTANRSMPEAAQEIRLHLNWNQVLARSHQRRTVRCSRATRKDFKMQTPGFVPFTLIILCALYRRRRRSCARLTQSHTSATLLGS